jgi:molybdate transport system substrate-binding protein
MRIVVLAVILCLALPVRAAELQVLCDGPLVPALSVIAGAFKAETGHVVRLATATSPELMTGLRGGKVADAVAIQRGLLDQLVAEGRAVDAPRVSLGRIGLGLAMRAGAVPFPVSDVASLRAALLSADAVIFNDVASGEYFATVIARLGIGADLQSRILRTNPAGVFRRLLEGQGRDIGVGTISLILATRGLALLAPLPGEFQAWLTYDAAPLGAAPEPMVTRQWIAFLQRPSSRAAFAAAGGEIMPD